MHQAVRQLAGELGITDAELLLLAREAAGDDVRAIEDLTEETLPGLISALLRIQDSVIA